ncbi:Ubiquitin thioesterase otubain-like [Acorus gramineus]|uniref:Ubiquitin thioesterase n=1 Tax=Acorus gramineus TaxID=55184 RepID=A0AAV9B3J0_ACOGR|nr:Ubiquitin thioesterase otubain-like [Acorus gramineus]
MQPPVAEPVVGEAVDDGGVGSSGLAEAEFDKAGWGSCGDDAIMQQEASIMASEAERVPLVGFKEPLSSLEAEYESGSPILLNKIKMLGEKYANIRRTRGDGNCFFRSFMFSYLEHVLETQDEVEINRISGNIEQCKKTLQSLGYADFTFEDFFSLFMELLDNVPRGKETSISLEELESRCRDPLVSDYVVMFFRFITAGEIRNRAEFFEPFLFDMGSVDQFCKSSVEPMGAESDHIHITAISDALGVPVRVEYLDRSSCDMGPQCANHHDFIPSVCQPSNDTVNPFITLLYRPGHYDILYPK